MILGGYRIRDGSIYPQYLGPEDLPWLASTLEEYSRFEGRPVRLLRQRWTEPPAVPGPEGKRRVIVEILDRLAHSRIRAPASPREVRRLVFLGRATMSGSARAVLEPASQKLGLTYQEIQAALFADLPGERAVGALPVDLTAASLIPRANLELVQHLLRRSTGVTIRVSGQSRALVHAARIRGLICTVEDSTAMVTDAACAKTVLRLSGPLSVVHRTLLYGRALAGLVPILPWCGRFILRASCLLHGQSLRFELRAGDAEFPGKEPRRFDSRLEEKFYQDFTKVAQDWNVFREPEPLGGHRGLIFPDFLIQHRLDPERRWWLEIVGFWTPQYVERKLAGLRAARVDRLILCLDADRDCGAAILPQARVLCFRRRIDVAEVLRVLEEEPVQP